MIRVTSFTHFLTGEGNRIAYSYSEISETGEIVKQNERGNFIVVDGETLAAINLINSKIQQKIEATE